MINASCLLTKVVLGITLAAKHASNLGIISVGLCKQLKTEKKVPGYCAFLTSHTYLEFHRQKYILKSLGYFHQREETTSRRYTSKVKTLEKNDHVYSIVWNREIRQH